MNTFGPHSHFKSFDTQLNIDDAGFLVNDINFQHIGIPHHLRGHDIICRGNIVVIGGTTDAVTCIYELTYLCYPFNSHLLYAIFYTIF